MLEIKEVESDLQVRFNSYLLPSIFLVIPPLLLYEHGSNLLDGSIKTGELVGLIIGLCLPLLGAFYFIEFAQFKFSKRDGLFSWQWRNLVRQKTGEIPLDKVVKVRREGLEASDLVGMQSSYRLVVNLDDGTLIALTRSYSGLHDRKLNKIVVQIRDYLGHLTPMD